MDQLILSFFKPNKEPKSEMIMYYFIPQTQKNPISETISSLWTVKYSLYLAFMSKELSSIEHKMRTVYHILFFKQSNICDDDRSRTSFFEMWNF
jgi:hypothetical protein